MCSLSYRFGPNLSQVDTHLAANYFGTRICRSRSRQLRHHSIFLLPLGRICLTIKLWLSARLPRLDRVSTARSWTSRTPFPILPFQKSGSGGPPTLSAACGHSRASGLSRRTEIESTSPLPRWLLLPLMTFHSTDAPNESKNTTARSRFVSISEHHFSSAALASSLMTLTSLSENSALDSFRLRSWLRLRTAILGDAGEQRHQGQERSCDRSHALAGRGPASRFPSRNAIFIYAASIRLRPGCWPEMVPCRCPQTAIPILNCAAAARTLWAENKLLATRAPFFDY